MLERLGDVVSRPLDVLVPLTCAACGIPGAGVCAQCRAELRAPPLPICRRCGHPAGFETLSCAECPPGLAWARQAVMYEGPAPLIVAALKDRRRRALARVMAEVISATIPPPTDAVLVPVPLSRRREAGRGFNQSLLIAKELGSLWETRMVDALERVREAAPQRGASATERTRQVAAAFRARAGRPVPAAVWIVDDVHTTGATLAACARALRRGGARHIGAVCFARAVSRGTAGRGAVEEVPIRGAHRSRR